MHIDLYLPFSNHYYQLMDSQSTSVCYIQTKAMVAYTQKLVLDFLDYSVAATIPAELSSKAVADCRHIATIIKQASQNRCKTDWIVRFVFHTYCRSCSLEGARLLFSSNWWSDRRRATDKVSFWGLGQGFKVCGRIDIGCTRNNSRLGEQGLGVVSTKGDIFADYGWWIISRNG